MTELLSLRLEQFPDFLTTNDLVNLGLYPSSDAASVARKRGNSPDYVRVGRRILFPKQNVIKFLADNTIKGNIPRECVDCQEDKC